MKIFFRPSLSIGIFASALMIGCSSSPSNSGSTTTTTGSGSVAAPTVSSISPTTIAAGSGQLTLTVAGTNFTSTTTIQVNGVADATTYVSGTQLTVAVPASQVASGAKLAVVAVNGAVTSDAGTPPMLEVDNPAPTVSGVAPAAIATGSGATTVTVTGTGFVPATVIQVNGSARTTTFLSATQASLALTAADLTASGSLSLTAVNAAPGGGSSSAAAVAVNNPAVGTAITLNPSTSAAGTTAPTTVTVTGSNFIAASSVLVGGAARPTTYVSSTQLTFQLSVADQATQGTLSVVVMNPAPDGGSSQAATFTVSAATATPVISSVNPTSLVAGSSDTQISVSGTNLQSNEIVQWNGTNLVTNSFYYYYYPTLVATVPASLMASTGTATITVDNPTALTQVSNALTVTIVNPPAPTLTSISPNYGPINTAQTITLNGTGFTGSSTVDYNGTPVTATFVNANQLTVTLPASSVALPGNGSFTVTTPAPGGGTTSGLVFSAYIPLVNNSTVYNPVNGLIYASIPGSVGAPMGNSIVSVNPATGVIGTPIYVGSEPNKLALTADGNYLWVGLDGSSAVRKVNLTTGTAGLQFALSTNNVGWYDNPGTAVALAALPGATDSVIVYSTGTSSSSSIMIYDSGVARANTSTTNSYGSPYALQVDGTKGEIYAGGYGLYTYTYGSNGLTSLASNTSINPATSQYDEMQLASGNIYTDFGTVYNAESGTLEGTLYQSGSTAAQGTTYVDTTLGKIFVVDNGSGSYYTGYNQIQIFNSDYTSNTAIPVNVPNYVPANTYTSIYPTRLTRWGANGLAFRTGIGIFSLESNLVKDLSTTNADLGVSLTATGAGTTGSSTTFTATVTNAGPSAASDVVFTAGTPSLGSVASVTASTGSCGSSSGTSCALGSLASGGSATVTITVFETASGTDTITAQVMGSTADPVSTNNTATASAAITGSAYALAPLLNSISPSSVLSGASDTTITVTGSNFSSGTSVLLGGSALTTTYVSSTELTATVPQASLATLGWQAISVSTPAPGGGNSQVLPLTVFSVVAVDANHILYDPYSRKIMASVASDSSTLTGNSIVNLTPETATLGTPVSIGSQPTKLALTDDGQILYTILTGSNSIARYNMLTGAEEYSYSVPDPTSYFTMSLRDIAALPGTENTVAVDGGEDLGTALFDFTPSSQSAAVRGSFTGTYTGSCLQFLDASDLYSFDIDTSGSTLIHFPVTSGGLTSAGSYTGGSTLNHFGCFKINGGLAFANAGGIANPASFPAVQVATLPGLTGGGFSSSQALAPDTSLQRAFYPAETTSSSTTVDGIAAYDLNTYLQSSIVPLNMASIEGSTTTYTQVDLIRWGQDGLAVLTSGGHIYLLRGPVVVPQLLNANSAATLASSSTSSITHGAGNTLLTLTGTNFVPGVAVTWNGSYRTTTIVDATHVTVAIAASDLASAGSGSLVATNPGASASSAVTVTIN